MTNEELSAKVAEARGEKLEPKKVLNSSHKDYGKMQDRFMHYCEDGLPGGVLPFPKPYATDMNCAWELVGEMTSGDIDTRVVSFGMGEVEFQVYEYERETLCIHGSPPCRAICKAYLKFKEQQ